MGDKTDGLTIFVELCDIEPATVVIAWPFSAAFLGILLSLGVYFVTSVTCILLS